MEMIDSQQAGPGFGFRDLAYPAAPARELAEVFVLSARQAVNCPVVAGHVRRIVAGADRLCRKSDHLGCHDTYST